MSPEAETSADDLRIAKLTDAELIQEYRASETEPAGFLHVSLATEIERRGLDV